MMGTTSTVMTVREYHHLGVFPDISEAKPIAGSVPRIGTTPQILMAV
jgi:hypothetical protein